MNNPLVITLGDPGGIGPEVVTRALVSLWTSDSLPPVLIVGPWWVRHHPLLKDDWDRLAPEYRSDHMPTPLSCPVSWVDPYPISDQVVTQPHLENGRASYQALITALQWVDALSGWLVTAPICKAAWQMAGSPYGDHTSLLGGWYGVSPTMGFYSPRFCVSLVTVHLPLSQVPGAVTHDAVSRCLHHTTHWLYQMGIKTPRVAVCGLNPHAGEGGALGHEETRVIAPAIQAIRQANPQARYTDPLPADTVFVRADQGDFDAVVCQYHDQGLGPLKLVAFDHAVNVTLGLPIGRSSPDHGTAFDRAWQGTAHAGSMIAALQYARRHHGG
ncbi:4-hydroxythreonine-4-phosphate dehydrogenase PdxA [bacterium]|nr:4-hydroxythreonine-4-phosphate dehydrogenase PdxA [bacterium]